MGPWLTRNFGFWLIFFLCCRIENFINVSEMRLKTKSGLITSDFGKFYALHTGEMLLLIGCEMIVNNVGPIPC